MSKTIERYPMIAYLQEGKKTEPGWLCKDEAAALNKTTKVHLDTVENYSGCIAKDKWVRQMERTASMVARGVDRVQPASTNMITKYVMSTLGSQYTSTKWQPIIQ